MENQENIQEIKQELSGQDRMDEKIRDMVSLMVRRGVVPDMRITNERIREARQKYARSVFRNTKVMLENYRNFIWVLECAPNQISQDLKEPLNDLTELINRVDVELVRNNRRLDSQMQELAVSKILVDKINEAVSFLQSSPQRGNLMYEIIYETYMSPNRINTELIPHRIGISPRSYYRYKNEAIRLISLRLWSAPDSELEQWVSIMEILKEYGTFA